MGFGVKLSWIVLLVRYAIFILYMLYLYLVINQNYICMCEYFSDICGFFASVGECSPFFVQVLLFVSSVPGCV